MQMIYHQQQMLANFSQAGADRFRSSVERFAPRGYIPSREPADAMSVSLIELLRLSLPGCEI